MRKGPVRKRGDENVVDMGHASSPAPASDPEASSPRARVPDVVPTGWLDRLLMVVLELPLLSGERAVVEAMVDSIAEILVSYAVGACLVAEPGTGRAEQLLVKRLPDGRSAAAESIRRVFSPTWLTEYVVAIPGDATGSTMHIIGRPQTRRDGRGGAPSSERHR
jgi:hypothetical protein